MPVSYSGTAITWPDNSTTTSGWTGFKNRIINGAMVIDQRNAGASVTPTTTTYTLDRWRVIASQSSKFSLQQNAGSVTPPVGFTNYLGVTSLSAYSVTTGDVFSLQQKIEGYNVADLGYGTANASTTTLSFWVRSSLTGTFGGVFGNEAANRCYVFSYTINAANTWEQKTITVTGDTTGTWLTNNGSGLDIRFSFGSGSDKLAAAGSWGSTFYNSVTGQTSVVGTNGATFYITGVQLERGSTASSFEYRDYGTELLRCQRYYEQWTMGDPVTSFYVGSGVGMCWTGTSARIQIQYFVRKRSAPSCSASGTIAWGTGSTPTSNQTSFSFDGSNVYTTLLYGTMASSFTAGTALQAYVAPNTTFTFIASAEL